MKTIEKSRGGRAHIKQLTGERNKDTYTINVSTPGDMMHVHNRRNTTRCMMLTT